MKKVARTNYKKFSDFEVGDMMNPNPLKYIKFEEKEMTKKKGGKFTAKSFIFEDVKTGQRIGIPHSGLINYFMENYEAGDVLNFQYNGKDDDTDPMSPHQVEVFECALNDGSEVDAKKIKEVQDNNVEEDEDGEEDGEEYV